MYFLNALHLKQFYASDLGMQVSHYLRRSMHGFWHNNPDDALLALGYPILLWDENDAPAKIVVVMPAEQGAQAWAGKTIVAHDGELPIPANSINRVVLIHSLEFSSDVGQLMSEVYRVLTPNGRVLLVTPNRAGLWSRTSKSPFGYGRPFSINQIKSLLEESELTFRRRKTAMFIPPVHLPLLLKAMPVMEFLGQFFVPMCGGIHIVEAEKQVHATIMQPIKTKSRRPVRAPITAAVPTQMHKGR